ncbi:MAG: glycosyl transferase, family 51 [Frankiales bacterium]|nr:glycosyl transferase, family 51 [Frankiales bacterium]
MLPRLGLALLVSVVSGLLLAGLAFPLVGGAGLAAKSSADDFMALPADLTAGPPPLRSRILAADGSLIATLYLQNRVNVALSHVPVSARQALVAIEDSRFYVHHGVDFKGVARAAVTNAGSGGVRQGASTLTQQYVKNALILAAPDAAGQRAAVADNLQRKLREARFAIALERKLTKDQILERYLNIAYYGHGVYGIGTAASYYFGKPVDKLTLAEGALLAGMVQNPTRFDPSSKVPAIRTVTKARRDTVLARMQALGLLSSTDRAAAEAAPIVTHLHPVVSGCENPAVRAPYFCDYVRRQLEETPLGAALGKTRAERQRALLAGGLTIRTTLDPVVQKTAQTAVDEQVPRDDPWGAAAAINMVVPGTGDIKAMAVDRTYGEVGARETKVNYATGGVQGFQAGSTFKAFVLAEALRQGIPLSLTLDSPQTYTSKVFVDGSGGGSTPYKISNAGDSEAGVFDLTTATALSVNTYFLQLEERTGIEKPIALAESLGVRQVADSTDDRPLGPNAAFVLGTDQVSPLAMAGAYAAFAAHGLYCPPRAVSQVLGPDGKALPLPQQNCTQVLEPGVADTVTSILRTVIDGSEPFRTGLRASIGRPAAGKTGTIDNSKAAWFVGFTPQLAASVWVGRPTPRPMEYVAINGRYYRSVYGGDIPASIWRQAMSGAMEGVPVQGFNGPDLTVARGSLVTVPDVTGQPYDVARQTLTDAGFGVVPGGSVAAAPVPYGSVGYTFPAAGRSVTQGATIVVYMSSGRAPAPTTAGPTPSPSASGSARVTPSPHPRPSRPAKPGG